MTDTGMLTGLVRLAEAAGADLVTLRALVEEATDAGATRALSRVGLNDTGAGADVGELRELLSAWREAKKSVWRGLIGWVTRAVLLAMLTALAVKLGIDGIGGTH